ncbi:Protein of unknown function [Oscillospiraceae bacterium]|nr:Protein of unknown function [Oscillospiraceae bacterium]
MGLNFRKSITILPGVRLNLSKSGVSASFGKKGMRQSISTSGRATTTLGIPGTGVYYTKQTNVKKLAGGLKDKFTGKKTDTKKEQKEEKKSSSKTIDNAQIEANKQQVEEYEAYVASIKSVHKQSDGMIDWNALNKGEVPTNIVKGSDEYKEWLELKEFSDEVLKGDIDSYFAIIDEVKPFDDLLEFGSNFQVGTDRADLIEIEFAVRSDDVVPKIEMSLKANGDIAEKELSKTAYFDLMQDYVASTTIRIARDAFALLPVDTVIVHAVDNILNTATGYEEELTLLSVKFTREKLMSLNLAMVDPSDALSQFECNMKFKKTQGFDPVNRVLA